VKRIVAPILGHRLILKPESRLRKVSAAKIVEDLVAEIAAPMIGEGGG
jgi:MoxR-like ATPase